MRKLLETPLGFDAIVLCAVTALTNSILFQSELKMTKSLKIAILPAALVLFAALPASADIAPDPCMGKAAGDMCTSVMGNAGTCVADPAAPMTLICQENGGTGGAGGGASSSSSSSTTTTSSGSPSDTDEDGGCSLKAGGAKENGLPALGIAGFALFAAALLRRRRS